MVTLKTSWVGQNTPVWFQPEAVQLDVISFVSFWWVVLAVVFLQAAGTRPV
jgi:hypothetical protein